MLFLERTIREVPVFDLNRLPSIMIEYISFFRELRMFPYNRIYCLEFRIHLNNALICPCKTIESSREFSEILIEYHEITGENSASIFESEVSIPKQYSKNENIDKHIRRKPLQFIEYEIFFFKWENRLYLQDEFFFGECLKMKCYHGSDIGHIIME